MGSIVLLSGGIDSAYLLTLLPRSRALFVDYGQPSAEMERQAARRLVDRFGWRLSEVTVPGLYLGDMERGYGAQVVPGRNLILIALAANFGREVWIGAAPQDAANYPDCREAFLGAASHALDVGYHAAVRWSDKSRILRRSALGDSVAALCWSCYGSGPEPCGECDSCLQE